MTQPARLTQQDIINAAQTLNVPVAAIHAIKTVESRGNGFLTGGRPVILFERHIMRRRLLKHGFSRPQVANLCIRFPNIVNTKSGGYSGYAGEYDRLQKAQRIDNDSAREACSWGLFQIMGYHWPRLGFNSIGEFVTAQEHSEGKQLETFVQFIQSDANLLGALQAQDWEDFARRYNGRNYRKNHYDAKLAYAFNHLTEAA